MPEMTVSFRTKNYIRFGVLLAEVLSVAILLAADTTANPQKTKEKYDFRMVLSRLIFYEQQARSDSAIYLLNSHLLCDSVNNTSSVPANAALSIGMMHRSFYNFQKAAVYFTEAFEKAIEAGNCLQVVQTAIHLGENWNKLGNREKALYYTFIAIALAPRLQQPAFEIEAQNQLGLIELDRENVSKSIENFEKAFRLAQKENLSSHQIRILMNLSRAHQNAGNFRESMQLADKCMELANASSEKTLLAEVMMQKASVLANHGNYPAAYRLLKQSIELSDTLQLLLRKDWLSEMETKHAFEKKMQDMQLLSTEAKIARLKWSRMRLIVYSLVVILFLVLVIAALLIQWNRLKFRTKTALLKQKLLQSQMNPHFIFNVIHAVQGYLFANKPENTAQYLSDFSKLMRLVLKNSAEDYVTLDSEVKMLSYYLELQKLRFENKFDYKISLSDDINPELIFLPPMLAQPFVENSIEHGIRQIGDRRIIQVRFHKSASYLHIDIYDNGIGYAAGKQTASHQYHEPSAIKITTERLKLINRQRTDKIILAIRNLQDEGISDRGTFVTFSIPLILQKETIAALC